MVGDPVELDARRRREFRRMVVVSVMVHAGALGLAVSSPSPRAEAPQGVITVALVPDPSMAPRPSRPKAAPPKKSPKTVLPAQPQELPKPKPKPEAPKPEPRKEVFLDQAPKEEKSLEDLLEDMREEQGEPAPEAPPQEEPVETAVAPTPGGGGSAGRVSPEVADWMRRAKIHVKRNWVVPPGFRTEMLTTHLMVTLDAGGNVVGTPEIVERSGNPWYDDGVVRSIQKASPLPPPPEAGEWDFVFVPEDTF